MAMTFNELLNKAPLLAKELGLNSLKVKLILDMMALGKIAKPSLEFKAIASKLNVAGKNPFLLLTGKKGSFLIPNIDLPLLKKDVQANLNTVVKLLDKANDKQKLGLEAQKIFFETLLDQIKKKKLLATYGKMAIKEKDPITKECFMSLEGMIKGEFTSAVALANELDNLGADLVAKNGDILRIFLPNKQEVVDSPSSDTSDPSMATDVDTDTEDTEDTVDVEALAATARETVALYKSFSITEMAAVKSEKSAQSILNAWDKGREIADKFEGWLEEADGNSKLTKEIASVNKANGFLTNMLTQLEPKVQQIQGGGGTTKLTPERRATMKKTMDKISARLETIAERLGVVV